MQELFTEKDYARERQKQGIFERKVTRILHTKGDRIRSALLAQPQLERAALWDVTDEEYRGMVDEVMGYDVRERRALHTAYKTDNSKGMEIKRNILLLIEQAVREPAFIDG